MWKCECKCGNMVELPTVLCGPNASRPNQSCGCMKSAANRKNLRSWKGHGDISGKYWGSVNRNAGKRGYEFSITMEFAWGVFLKQNGKCNLTGIDLKFPKSTKDMETGGGTASLDRIDNDKGYTKSNIHWVHKDVNCMKMDFTMERFRELCFLVVQRSNEVFGKNV